MKIIDVKATQIHLGRVEKPFRDATVGLRDRVFGMVEVITDEGIAGICPREANPQVVEQVLKPRIVGENPLNYERLWRKLQPRIPAHLYDTSKIDVAIWDLIGKALQQPVWRLLGGAQPVVAVYCAGGYYADGKTIPDLQEEMREYVEMGYAAVKMKVGGAPFREDVARVKAVREAIGSDIDLMIDANHAWTATEASRFVHAVEEFQPFWFEEPVESQNVQATAEVRAATAIPIATGELLQGRHAFANLIDAQAADIIQADAYNCGGITEWRKIAAYAQAHDLRMAPHGSPLIGEHLVAAVPHGLIVESGLYRPPRAGRHWRGTDPLEPPVFQVPAVQDGKLVLSERPGLGLQIDHDRLRALQERASSPASPG
ncbi:MAG: hypothetical protein CL878_03470 [Dehalococcoidia bacterium]|nr:hypothetical protein [Dehalococcoidia bacterium]